MALKPKDILDSVTGLGRGAVSLGTGLVRRVG
ncbi:MAG: hypothetical protein QOE28_1453, partial [Solirubrobacteraceae bacterium]|nr:hypothetical protein [Solirubrobacteraceae bacterium]